MNLVVHGPMKIENLEAIVHCLDQSEILGYLEDLRDRCRLISHGHIVVQRAMEFNNDINVVRILLERVPEIPVNLHTDGNTLLHIAVSLGNKDYVKWVLNRADVDPNLYNQRGETPIHVAASHGCLEIMDILLSDRRVNVFALTKLKQTVLHLANCYPSLDNSARKVTEVVRKLRGLAATSGFLQFLKKQDSFGKTALHYLGDNGFEVAIVEIFKDLQFEDKLELALLSDKEGQIALHLAVEKGHQRAVQCLLPFDDQLNGMRTLIYGVKSGRKDILEACLSTSFLGCAIGLEKVVDSYLELLAQASHYEIAIYLLQSLYENHIMGANEFPSLLHWAIKVNEGQGVSLLQHIFKWQQHLIGLPLDVDTNQTPLHMAVIKGNYNAVQALCTSLWNFDANQKDFRNMTPFDYGNESMRRMILQREDVKQYLQRLRKNREMYVVASNSILVVSVLVVTVTFAHCPSREEVAKLKADLQDEKLVVRIADTIVATSSAFILSMIATILAAFAALPFSFAPFFFETIDDDTLRSSLIRTKILVVLASHFLMLALAVISFAFVCTTFIAPWVNWECQSVCLAAVGFFFCVSLAFLVAHGIKFFRSKQLKKKRALLKQIV